MTKLAVSSWLVAVDQRALKKQRRHDRLGQAFEADQVQPVPHDRSCISTPPAAAESILTQLAEAEGTSTPPAAAKTRLAQKRGDQSSLPRLSRDPLPGGFHAASVVLEGTTTECLTQERNVQEQLRHDMSWTERVPSATVQDSAETEVDTAAIAARLPIPCSWSRMATVASTRRRLRRKNDSEHAMRTGHVEAETDTCNDDIETQMTSALLHPPEHTDTNTRARGPFQFPVKRLLSIEDFGVRAPKVQATMPLAVEFKTCHLCGGHEEIRNFPTCCTSTSAHTTACLPNP